MTMSLSEFEARLPEEGLTELPGATLEKLDAAKGIRL
jgi:hypothetical protein